MMLALNGGGVLATLLVVLQLQTAKLHLPNSATMILLPKCEDAVSPKEFMSINLIHGFAKLFIKLLACHSRSRMKELTLPC